MNEPESDELAVTEVLDVIGQSSIDDLAAAARAHNVTISIYITPTENAEEVRDPND